MQAAPAPPPPTLQVALAAALPDGGLQEIPLRPGERPALEPTSGLEVRLNLPLSDYRIRIFDEVDRALVSDDSPSEDPRGSLRYAIALHEPLRTGHKYSLVIDSQTGAALTDANGRSWEDQRLEFQVTGEREKPAPAKPVRRRKR